MSPPLDFIVDAAAVHRATRLLTEDTIAQPLRDRIWRLHPPTDTHPYTLGYMSTCPYCASIWAAAAVTLTHTRAFRFTRPLVYLLAIADLTAILAEKTATTTTIPEHGTGWS